MLWINSINFDGFSSYFTDPERYLCRLQGEKESNSDEKLKERIPYLIEHLIITCELWETLAAPNDNAMIMLSAGRFKISSSELNDGLRGFAWDSTGKLIMNEIN